MADSEEERTARNKALLARMGLHRPGPKFSPKSIWKSTTPSHCSVLADAWRARRDSPDEPARHCRIRDDPTATARSFDRPKKCAASCMIAARCGPVCHPTFFLIFRAV
jgi:hypothetical protein